MHAAAFGGIACLVTYLERVVKLALAAPAEHADRQVLHQLDRHGGPVCLDSDRLGRWLGFRPGRLGLGSRLGLVGVAFVHVVNGRTVDDHHHGVDARGPERLASRERALGQLVLLVVNRVEPFLEQLEPFAAVAE